MKSKFFFTWHLRPSRLIPLQPSLSLPDSGRSGWLPSPDPRYALALSWVAPSAGGDFSFLTSLLNWAILPWLSPDAPPAPPASVLFPWSCLVFCSRCQCLSPTLLQVSSRAGTLWFPSLIFSPKPPVWDRVCAR